MKQLMSILSFLMMLPFLCDAQLNGAWQSSSGTESISMIVSGKYFAVSQYDLNGKKFVGTWGGKWTEEKNEFTMDYEFHTISPEKVGATESYSIQKKKNKITLKKGEQVWELDRTDDGKPGALEGAWLITGRMVDGKATTNTPGVRRTMKILSGTRFQWIAYNVQTKEFFGTGGGTYTTVNGKYTEQLEFFSRDNSRVGNSLQFDFSIEEGRWRHRGLSSKGEPIDEYWSKREAIGI